MGIFGGSGGGTKLTGKSKFAGNFLLGSMSPGGGQGGGIDLEKYLGLPEGFEYGSNLEGLPGVTTWDSNGNIINPGESSGLGSLLPRFADIGNYDTLFEKVDAGKLSPSAQKLFDNFSGMATGGTDAIKDLLGSFGGAGGGMSGGGGSVSAPSDPVFNAPDNIGALTSEILSSMPPEFQEFTQRVLDSSDPDVFEQELQNFEDHMTTKMFADLDSAGDDLISIFASQGMGAAGAAIQGAKEMFTRGVIETNAIIATERMKSLQIMTDRLALGNNLTNILLSAGATQHANLVQGEIARMETKMAGEIQHMNAQTQLQIKAMDVHTQQMSIMAGAAVDMYRTQAGLADSAFRGLLTESQNEEANMDMAMKMPYEVLMSQTGQMQQKGQGGFDLGSVLGGGLALAGSFL